MQTTPQPFHIPFNRRRLIRSLALAGGALFATRGLFAEMLTLTPRTTAGPYYPDHLPLDQDTKELAATWDIVMGLTPGDAGHDDHDHGAPPPRGDRPERPCGQRRAAFSEVHAMQRCSGCRL